MIKYKGGTHQDLFTMKYSIIFISFLFFCTSSFATSPVENTLSTGIETHVKKEKKLTGLKERVLFCSVYKILDQNDSPKGAVISAGNENLEYFSTEVIHLGVLFGRKDREVKMQFGNEGEFIYVDFERGARNASRVSIKNYTKDIKKTLYDTKIKYSKYFKMADLEKGNKLILPVRVFSEDERYLTCKLHGSGN